MSNDDQRMQLIEDNVPAFLLEMGRVGGGDERQDAEIMWTVGGSPLAYHNAVVRCDADSSRADSLIEAWASELQRRGLSGSWHVSASMRPVDLVERMVARGFEDGGDEPGMIADLAVVPLDLPMPPEFAIGRVVDDAGMGAYEGVLAADFGEGPKEAAWVADVFRRIGYNDDVPWRHYVGRLGGEPVSTVTMFLTPGVAGIYFVCTASAARKRGIGGATTLHAMRNGRAMGCAHAVLGSSPMGYGVYRRLGFEEVCRYRIMEWRSRSDGQR